MLTKQGGTHRDRTLNNPSDDEQCMTEVRGGRHNKTH